MILGTGIDYIETVRVERELARGDWKTGDGIFTAGEIAFCTSSANPAGDYAACFAAKEATMKALGVTPRDLSLFCEVELEAGRCHELRIRLHNRLKRESERLGVLGVRVSVAQNSRQTAVVVVLEN